MIVLEEHSKITAKGQTTVPKRVRDRLGLQVGDEIVFRVSDDGAVMVESARQSDDEAAVDAFLAFISSDIKRRPEALKPLRQEDVDRRRALLEGVELDLDGDFSGATPI